MQTFIKKKMEELQGHAKARQKEGAQEQTIGKGSNPSNQEANFFNWNSASVPRDV